MLVFSPAGILAAGLALVATAGGEEPAQADPAAVQRFLSELEAQQAAMALPPKDGAGGERREGTTKRITNLVESAAKRAPSTSTLDQIETAIVGRLEG